MKTDINLPDIVGKGYGTFFRDTSRYRVLMGGKASKKSTTTALNIIYRMMAYPEANTLVVRSVMDTHRSSTFAQLKWAQERLGVADQWKNLVSPMEMTYIPTGQKILFRGFDDPLKLASTTVSQGYLCWVWIEEAFEIASEEDFDKFDLSVPRGEIPKGLFKQTTLTLNPWSENHWIKRRFFDRKRPDASTYVTTFRDNEFLDDTDLAVFERMKNENPRRYEIIGLGHWGIAEGLIYDRWSVEDFDISRIGISLDSLGHDIDERWKYIHVRGLDFGYTNDPSAFIAAAFNPIDKICYIYDEFYERGMLNSDIANAIRAKGYAKDRIRADAAEPKSIDTLRHEHGIHRIKESVKGRDSVLSGIHELQEYRFIVHERCKNTAAELSAYVWDQNKNGDGINKPVDRNNHIMDALRYAFQDVKEFRPISPEQKRKNERIDRRVSFIGGEDMIGGWS